MRKKKSLSIRSRRAIIGYLFISPFILGFLFFILSPVISSVRMSLSEVSLNTGGSGFSMRFIGLENFIKAFTVDKDFNRLLVGSVQELLIDVPCIIIFSLLAAIMLNRKFKGRAVVRAIFFMPVILASGVVLGMEKSNTLLTGVQALQKASTDTTITSTVENILLGAFRSSGTGLVEVILNIINHFYDIVISSSIQTVIFLSALQTINPAIYESAELEGCGKWETLWKITIPMVSPIILVNWIYTIVDRFIRSDNKLMTKILDEIHVTLNYGYSSAMAWIYCLCMLALIGVSTIIISRMVYYYE